MAFSTRKLVHCFSHSSPISDRHNGDCYAASSIQLCVSAVEEATRYEFASHSPQTVTEDSLCQFTASSTVHIPISSNKSGHISLLRFWWKACFGCVFFWGFLFQYSANTTIRMCSGGLFDFSIKWGKHVNNAPCIFRQGGRLKMEHSSWKLFTENENVE